MDVHAHAVCHPVVGSNQKSFGILAWDETVSGEHLACHAKPIDDADAIGACFFTFPTLSTFGTDAMPLRFSW